MQKKFDAVKKLRGNKPEPRTIKRSDGTKLGTSDGNNFDKLQEKVVEQLTGELYSDADNKPSPVQHTKIRRLDDPETQPPRKAQASLQEAIESTLADETDQKELLDDPCEYKSWTKEV